ncbi:WSC-domain-containing protein [Tothia fuscella]|uniref:WSC-domain-containing protein n=1 Tax=Tothia fuscella TaxID=1048955 RepID=A0A9P4TVI2_9PEZI|nr:WSC-domain-containing protein [Tothia fuscella]
MSTATTSSKATGPTALPTVSSYTHKGCYNETLGRTFAASSLTNNTGMTVEMCATYCTSYAWFGVEAGTQCYCGPYPRPGSGLVPAQNDCKTLCVGDKSEYCGATNKLNAYFSSDPDKVSKDPASPSQVGVYTYMGCIMDSPRLLSNKILASDSMSIETCIDLADAAGYQYAGLEYGRECWVGNSLLNPTSSAPASACNIPCKGSVGELCGAASRLSLYRRAPTVN